MDLTSEDCPSDSNTVLEVNDDVPSRSPPSSARIQHVKGVQETVCDEKQWHIARLHAKSAKIFFAQQSKSRKKCVAMIVQDGTATAASTYTGVMDNFKKSREEIMQFFFSTTTLKDV